MNDIGRTANLVIIGIFSVFSIILVISVIKKSKEYLISIKIEGETCEFEVSEYDKPKEIISTKLSETRIKIWEIFFPFTKFGRNFKLVIETKQGVTYKKIIQQYEIGNWDLDYFREVIKLYGETKGISAPTDSYSRNNFD